MFGTITFDENMDIYVFLTVIEDRDGGEHFDLFSTVRLSTEEKLKIWKPWK